MINSNMIPGPIFNHFIFNTYLSWYIIAFLLERVFHSRGQQPCRIIATKDSVYTTIPTGLVVMAAVSLS